MYPEFAVGQKVIFAEFTRSWTVRAVSTSGRFVAFTSTMFGKLGYTVADLTLGVRGTASSWGVSFTTDEDCVAALAAFERGAAGIVDGSITSQVSHRNWVWLRYAAVQRDERTAAMLQELREITSAAPARTNDWNPRVSA